MRAGPTSAHCRSDGVGRKLQNGAPRKRSLEHSSPQTSVAEPVGQRHRARQTQTVTSAVPSARTPGLDVRRVQARRPAGADAMSARSRLRRRQPACGGVDRPGSLNSTQTAPRCMEAAVWRVRATTAAGRRKEHYTAPASTASVHGKATGARAVGGVGSYGWSTRRARAASRPDSASRRSHTAVAGTTSNPPIGFPSRRSQMTSAITPVV
jgi:hypothetical protein